MIASATVQRQRLLPVLHLILDALRGLNQHSNLFLSMIAPISFMRLIFWHAKYCGLRWLLFHEVHISIGRWACVEFDSWKSHRGLRRVRARLQVMVHIGPAMVIDASWQRSQIPLTHKLQSKFVTYARSRDLRYISLRIVRYHIFVDAQCSIQSIILDWLMYASGSIAPYLANLETKRSEKYSS